MTERALGSVHDDKESELRPLLRWAGGKRWLIPTVKELVSGYTFNAYHEPFLGGAAMFFGNNFAKAAYLNDTNAELIEMYEQVRDYPLQVSRLLSNYENTSQNYYTVRSAKPDNALERAARFLFLNHTSFNGIYRVNLSGDYNVPFGNRKSINPPDEKHLLRASHRLKNATLTSVDFEAAMAMVAERDLVFLDPPYTVAHNNNGFIKYNQKLFSFEDQVRLSEALINLGERGAHFILTNAAHSSIKNLFGSTGKCLTISRGNYIGGIKAARGRADEYMFTNLTMGV